jgi:hypothetical protein
VTKYGQLRFLPLAIWSLLTGLSLLLPYRVTAESPPWLSLIRPDHGRLTLSGTVNWSHVEESHPELWTRMASEEVTRRYGFDIWYRLGRSNPNAELTHALVLNTAVGQTSGRSTIHTWTPAGPESSAAVADGAALPYLRIGWQLEQVTTLWRRGAEVGLIPALTAQRGFDISFWLARAYEPAILSFGMMHDLRGPLPAGLATRLGVEVALNRRLILASAALLEWPRRRPTPNQRGDDPHATQNETWPELSVSLAAKLQYEDRSGWSLAVRTGPLAHGISLEHSLPVP